MDTSTFALSRFEPAPMSRRVPAAILDMLTVQVALWYSVIRWGEVLPDGDLGWRGLNAILVIGLIVCYWVLPEWAFGATLGKWVFGLRVRTLRGGEIGIGQACLRFLAYLLEGGSFGLIAYLVARGNPRGQRLGDKWAGTQVVGVGAKPAPVIAEQGAPIPVPIGLRLAPLWRRGVAAFLDVVIAFFGMVVVAANFGRDLGDGRKGWNGWEGLVALVVLASYWFVPEWLWGVTLSKLALGIRVVGMDGSAVSLTQALQRHLLRILEFFGFFYLIAYAVAKNNPKRQRPGDLWAGTIVVLDSEVPLPTEGPPTT